MVDVRKSSHLYTPHQIEAIYDTVDYGKVIKIGGHMFLPYHLTLTNSYDMI